MVMVLPASLHGVVLGGVLAALESGLRLLPQLLRVPALGAAHPAISGGNVDVRFCRAGDARPASLDSDASSAPTWWHYRVHVFRPRSSYQRACRYGPVSQAGLAPRICQCRVPRELHWTDARRLQRACTPVTRLSIGAPTAIRPPVVRAGSANAHRTLVPHEQTPLITLAQQLRPGMSAGHVAIAWTRVDDTNCPDG